MARRIFFLVFKAFVPFLTLVILFYEVSALDFVVDDKTTHAIATELFATALLGIEVVLPCFTRQNLPCAGQFKAF